MRRSILVALPVLLLVVVLGAGLARADWGHGWRRPGPGTGTLVVVSRPWSNVIVDGRRLGSTPVRVELSAGRHRLELRNGDGRHRERIVIRAGETKRVMHRF